MKKMIGFHGAGLLMMLMTGVSTVYGQTNIDTEDLKSQKEKLGVDFKELSEKYAEERKTDAGMYM